MKQAARPTRDSRPADEQAANDDAGHSIEWSSLGQQLLVQARDGIRKYPLTVTGGAFALGFVFGSRVPKVVARTAVAFGLRVLLQRVFEPTDDLD